MNIVIFVNVLTITIVSLLMITQIVPSNVVIILMLLIITMMNLLSDMIYEI